MSKTPYILAMKPVAKRSFKVKIYSDDCVSMNENNFDIMYRRINNRAIQKKNNPIAVKHENFLYEWNGYTPHLLGDLFHEKRFSLGGESEFKHCYKVIGSSMGDWIVWLADKLDKLTVDEKNRLLDILARNKKYKTELDAKLEEGSRSNT